MGLRLPLAYVLGQLRLRSLRFGKRLGRQDFHALRQQHSGLTLDHHLVLQLFNQSHFFGQGHFQGGQGFTRQGCASLGGIALPSHGVSNVQPRA